MTLNNGYFEWNKGENVNVSGSFTTSEFSCQCTNGSCNLQRISEDLVNRLQNLRTEYGSPIRITSGFRCHAHQLELAASGLETAKGTSQHELGNAADIAGANMHEVLVLSSKYFNAIGAAKSFIHVDTRPPHADGTKRLWSYQRV